MDEFGFFSLSGFVPSNCSVTIEHSKGYDMKYSASNGTPDSSTDFPDDFLGTKKQIKQANEYDDDIEIIEPTKHVPPTICQVCGDKATGYHYEVSSCNGCKTFFRRTVLTERKYICRLDGLCFTKPPKDKRCICKACRFNKCVDVGMNPLAIQVPKEHLEKNKFVEAICKKRKMEEELHQPSTSLEIPSAICVENSMEKLLDELLYLEFKIETFRKSSYNPDSFSVTLEQLVYSQSCLSLAERLGPMQGWPLDKSKFAKEWKKSPPWMRKKEPTWKDWVICDLIASVEYTKTFSFYHELNDSDKLILLKGIGILCYNITQAFYSFTKKSSLMTYPDGTFMKDTKCPLAYFSDFVTTKKNCIGVLFRENLSRAEYVLIKNILTCNSCVSGLSENAMRALENQRSKASKMLLSLCLKEHGVSGPSRYAALIGLVDFFEHVSAQQKDIHLMIDIARGTKPRRPLLMQMMR